MLKILIAEDEPLEQQTIKKLLEKHYAYAADIRVADNGMDAVSMAQLWNADLVLMDIEMPVISGIDAALKIVTQNPRAKLIFITAYDRFEYAVEAVRLRAVDYLLKPVEDEKLVAVVGRTIEELKEQALFYEQVQRMQERQPEVPDASPQDARLEDGRPNSQADSAAGPLTDCKKKTAREGAAAEAACQDRNRLLMQKVADYVEKNYQYDISQEVICDILNMSTGYFSKLFHQCYGVKFIDHLTNVRVEAAKSMLADPTMRSSEIGKRVGYQSSSYFSKIFKQKTGITPSEDRARLDVD